MASATPSWLRIADTVAGLSAQLEDSISKGRVIGLEVSDIKHLTWHDAQRLISASSLPDGHPTIWSAQMSLQSRGDRAKGYGPVLESIKDDLKIHRMDLASAWGESCDDAEEGMNLYLSGVREKFKDMKGKEGISQAAQNGFLELSLMWGQTADCISSLVLLSQAVGGTTNSMIEAMKTAIPKRMRTSSTWRSAMNTIRPEREALLKQSSIADKDKLWANASALSADTRELVEERYDWDRAFQAEIRLLTEQGGLNAGHCTLGRLEELRDWYRKEEDELRATTSETSEMRRQPKQPISAITEAAKKLTEVGGGVASAWSRWARSLTGAQSHKAVDNMSERQDQLFNKMAEMMTPVVPAPLARLIIQEGDTSPDSSARCTDPQDTLDALSTNDSAKSDDQACAAEGEGGKSDLLTVGGTVAEDDMDDTLDLAFHTQDSDGRTHELDAISDDGSVTVVESLLGDNSPAEELDLKKEKKRTTSIEFHESESAVNDTPGDLRTELQTSEIESDSVPLSLTSAPLSPSVSAAGREAWGLNAEKEHPASGNKGKDSAGESTYSPVSLSRVSEADSQERFNAQMLHALLTQRSPGTTQVTPLAARPKIPLYDNAEWNPDPWFLEQEERKKQAEAEGNAWPPPDGEEDERNYYADGPHREPICEGFKGPEIDADMMGRVKRSVSY